MDRRDIMLTVIIIGYVLLMGGLITVAVMNRPNEKDVEKCVDEKTAPFKKFNADTLEVDSYYLAWCKGRYNL